MLFAVGHFNFDFFLKNRPWVTGQIAAGHHRIEAAKRAGIKTADIHVADIDDDAALRIYAVENATQRSARSHALAGVVIAAVAMVARALLSGGGSEKFFRTSVPELQGHLATTRGVGRDAVAEWLGWRGPW